MWLHRSARPKQESTTQFSKYAVASCAGGTMQTEAQHRASALKAVADEGDEMDIKSEHRVVGAPETFGKNE